MQKQGSDTLYIENIGLVADHEEEEPAEKITDTAACCNVTMSAKLQISVLFYIICYLLYLPLRVSTTGAFIFTLQTQNKKAMH